MQQTAGLGQLHLLSPSAPFHIKAVWNVRIHFPSVCFGYSEFKFSITAFFHHVESIIRGVPHVILVFDVRAPSNFKCMPDCDVRYSLEPRDAMTSQKFINSAGLFR